MSGFGLLQVDFRSEEEIGREEQTEEAKRRAVEDALGAMLYGRFCEWRDARRDKEEEWLEDLRAYNGIYEADIEAKLDEDRSDVYVHLTRTKVLSAYTRIVDLLFQSSDKHWSISPTPIPEGENFTDMWGRPLPREMVLEIAKHTADKMETTIEDQLEEADYETAVKQGLAECTIVGSGAVKGVTVGVERKSSWRQLPNGWGVHNNEKIVPDISPVSVFDLYPDPYALLLKHALGIFERHILTRPQFRDLSERYNFDQDAVYEIMDAHPQGNYTEEHHETERRRIAGYNTTTGNTGRMEVLEYWGWVSGQELEGCGCEVPDPTQDYQANVWICGSRTVLARLNPQMPEGLPYHIWPYERVPHQFWGVGVPRQMRDSQTTMNDAVRTMLDNLGISSGPIMEMNLDLMAPGENAKEIFPWKIFAREGGDPAYPMIRFHQPQNITQGLGQVIDLFRRFADEETSLPSYTHGQHTPGMTKTASGMSMLMGAANISIKGIIKHIDDYLIKPLLKSLYDFNMRWGDDQEIKGDMNIVARGSTTLVAKEIQSQRLIQFLQMTANPLDQPLVDRLALLREVAEAMDIDAGKVIRDEQDFIQGGGVPGQPQAPGGPGGGGGGPVIGDPGMGAAGGLPAAEAAPVM